MAEHNIVRSAPPDRIEIVQKARAFNKIRKGTFAPRSYIGIMPKQRLNLLFSRKSGILVTVTVGVNHEASPAKLADKLSTRVGVMTRIVVYSRINVANAGHLLLDFLLKGSIKQQSELAQHMLAWRRFN